MKPQGIRGRLLNSPTRFNEVSMLSIILIIRTSILSTPKLKHLYVTRLELNREDEWRVWEGECLINFHSDTIIIFSVLKFHDINKNIYIIERLQTSTTWDLNVGSSHDTTCMQLNNANIKFVSLSLFCFFPFCYR